MTIFFGAIVFTRVFIKESFKSYQVFSSYSNEAFEHDILNLFPYVSTGEVLIFLFFVSCFLI